MPGVAGVKPFTGMAARLCINVATPTRSRGTAQGCRLALGGWADGPNGGCRPAFADLPIGRPQESEWGAICAAAVSSAGGRNPDRVGSNTGQG
jgi:hypothetical protein